MAHLLCDLKHCHAPSASLPYPELPDGRNRRVRPFLGSLLYQLISATAVSADIDRTVIILFNIVHWHSRNNIQIERCPGFSPIDALENANISRCIERLPA